jgi:hypothetical protein
MSRILFSLLLFAAVGFPALAEEISLKDGTKIVGHMTAVTADKVEVETTYGKVQLKRTDIVTISFPENTPSKTPVATPATPEAPKVEESLQGVRYLNKTGKFSLTLPQDWVINSDLHRSPGTFTVLTSKDQMRFLVVSQEDYPGSLDSYKELVMLNARRTLTSLEESAPSNITIDGKPGLLVYYRGNQKGGLPMAFVSAMVVSGHTYTKITLWCIEPLFHDMQPTFEKILMSYHSSGQTTTAAVSSKP